MSKKNKTQKQSINKNTIIIKNVDSWSPSSFYDENTNLLWVNTFSLFKQIYINNITPPNNTKYAIYKDVYRAFMYKYNHIHKKNKTRKKTHKKNT
jgi:hypothetical protein